MHKKVKDKIKCPYCGRKFNRITANHIKTHGKTWTQYLKEYRKEDYLNNLLIKFFNEFYITIRHRYLYYPQTGEHPVEMKRNSNLLKTSAEFLVGVELKQEKVCYGLTDRELKAHLNQTSTIGIFFSEEGSKIICFDLDILDIDALERVYNSLVRFVPESSIMISSSGGKGFHIELFLERILNRDIIKRFYEIILDETNLNKHELELRGASKQGYKLPFGMHFGKGKYCYACNQFGVEIKDIESLIAGRTKADIRSIIQAVEINLNDDNVIIPIEDVNILSDEEIIEFEDMTADITMLESYDNLNEDFIADLSLIYRNGFDGSGIRSVYTLKIALFLKSHMRFNEDIVLEEMLLWMDKCSGYKDSRETFEYDIRATVKHIFEDDMKLTIAAKEITISKVEIKEILSIKCRTSQETRALRQLYYIMFLHSKAYGDIESVFFMTYEQMETMGASKNRSIVKKQIEKLIEYNKIYKYPNKRKSRIRFAPNEYKLIALSSYTITENTKIFRLCHDSKMCKDCLEKATCYLISNTSERYKYMKVKKLECPYNKR